MDYMMKYYQQTVDLHWVIKWLWLNEVQSWKPHYVLYFRNALPSIGKIFVIDFFPIFRFFTEGSCEYVKNDHVLLNISAVTGKWFRKFVFDFNLTGVYIMQAKYHLVSVEACTFWALTKPLLRSKVSKKWLSSNTVILSKSVFMAPNFFMQMFIVSILCMQNIRWLQ